MCNACLICSVNSMPAPTPTPPTTPSVGYAPSAQFNALDEWMRNASSASAPTDASLFFQQPIPNMSSYPAYVSSLDNTLQSQGTFNPYAMNVFDEGPSTSSDVRAMSIGVRSSSDGGLSLEGLGVSPVTRRSSSFSGVSPSPREWMPPPPPIPDMGLDDNSSSYQRPFFSNPKAASTTSLLLPSDIISLSLGRSSSSRSTTDLSSPSAFRSDFSAGLDDDLDSMMSFAAGKFNFGEGFVEGFSGAEEVGESSENRNNDGNDMELANQYGFERTL